jgi:hypothetical protein
LKGIKRRKNGEEDYCIYYKPGDVIDPGMCNNQIIQACAEALEGQKINEQQV